MTSSERLKGLICDSFEIVVDRRKPERWVISTPFVFEDGDEYPLFLERRDDQWFLLDDGMTVSHLYFDEFRGTPGQIDRIRHLVRSASCEIDEFFCVRMPLSSEPDAFDVADFIALESQIKGLALEQAPVRERRYDYQVIRGIEERIASPYEKFWSPPSIEARATGRYRADLMIDAGQVIAAFAASTAEKVHASTIAIQAFRKFGFVDFRPVMFFHPDLDDSDALHKFHDFAETATNIAVRPGDTATLVGSLERLGVRVHNP